MLMEIFMKDNGKMIKLMEKEFILMLMEQCMKENGKMINSMDLEQKTGLIMLIMKEHIVKAKNMVKEF